MAATGGGGYVWSVRLLEALRHLRESTGNNELPVQTVMTFAFIASRHPTEVPLGEIEQRLGFTQTTASRNVMYLSRGGVNGLRGTG